MAEQERNAAIVCISKEAILDWLQLEGGVIHSVRTNPDTLHPDIIELIIEHPDLDKVRDGDILRRITLEYKSWIHGRFCKRLRVDPPKGARHG